MFGILPTSISFAPYFNELNVRRDLKVNQPGPRIKDCWDRTSHQADLLILPGVRDTNLSGANLGTSSLMVVRRTETQGVSSPSNLVFQRLYPLTGRPSLWLLFVGRATKSNLPRSTTATPRLLSRPAPPGNCPLTLAKVTHPHAAQYSYPSCVTNSRKPRTIGACSLNFALW